MNSTDTKILIIINLMNLFSNPPMIWCWVAENCNGAGKEDGNRMQKTQRIEIHLKIKLHENKLATTQKFHWSIKIHSENKNWYKNLIKIIWNGSRLARLPVENAQIAPGSNRSTPSRTHQTKEPLGNRSETTLRPVEHTKVKNRSETARKPLGNYSAPSRTHQSDTGFAPEPLSLSQQKTPTTTRKLMGKKLAPEPLGNRSACQLKTPKRCQVERERKKEDLWFAFRFFFMIFFSLDISSLFLSLFWAFFVVRLVDMWWVAFRLYSMGCLTGFEFLFFSWPFFFGGNFRSASAWPFFLSSASSALPSLFWFIDSRFIRNWLFPPFWKLENVRRNSSGISVEFFKWFWINEYMYIYIYLFFL